MKPNQLRAMVALAAQRSIRGAARQLGVSQPAVTRIVRELERDYGVPIVERSPRGIRLTVYGEALAPRAGLMLADLDRMRRTVAELRDGSTGEVSIGVLGTFALTRLPLAFERFHARWPQVDLRVIDGALPYLIDQLRAGRKDFIVSYLLPELIGDEFDCTPLYSAAMLLIARDGHPLAKSRSLRPLIDAEWVLPTDDERSRATVRAMFGRLGLATPARMVGTPSLLVLLGLVARLDLIGVLIDQSAERILVPFGLKRIAIREQLPGVTIGIIRRRDSPLTPAAERLADCIVETARARRAAP